ncbi:efflux RND transporter permease subunit [Halosolutus gelatinilyticus]|uniref:efflux RND transporter permease subunit n=1 Tax=Halosolutus gelatinilyticus TaxID=2931975 RepID=UPI001FF68C11|nr:MMPL family transporter [Halosolutus gelatinilyticus]
MNGGVAARFAAAIVDNSRLVVVLVVLLTAVVAAGAAIGDPEDGGIGRFDVDSEETRAREEIESTYGTDDAIVAQIVVRDEGGDVLARESLLEGLRLQRDVREDDDLNATLDERGIVGLENAVATAAVFEDRRAAANGPPDASEPTLDEQITALESRSDEEVEALLADVLDPDADGARGQPGPGAVGGDPYEFLPIDYEPGSTTADARIAFVFQTDDSGPDEDPEAAYEAQVAIADRVDDRFDDAFVFGQGIVDEASASAVGDSFAIITPVALAFVLVALGTAYRDVVDVLVSIVGIAVVMAWLAGVQGWLEIPSSQLLIAVPFLLIGLSIDYSLHVIMRSREARAGALKRDSGDDDRRGVRAGVRVGLAGVLLALAAATFSTGIGFLSNVVSPLPAIRDFAILCAAGILATLVSFAVFVPALKVEVDSLLEGRFGIDRRKRPFGTGPGPVNRALSSGAFLARRAPIAVVIVALVLAAGGAYGAAGIDTEFNQSDFLPRDAPDWAKSLPGPLATGTYTISDDAEYLGENFQERGEGSRTQVLIREGATDPATLAAVDDAATDLDPESTEAVVVRSDGRPAIESPVTVLREVASENESVAAALDERDADGDGLPDEDLGGLYDVLYEADADAASSVLHRTGDGADREYESARLLVSVRGDAAAQDAAADTRSIAAAIESGSSGAATAVATGGPVTTAVVQDALLETLVRAFALTLVVILAFLTVLYWVRYRSLSLGVVTLAPVVAALAWLLGLMAVLDLPFNSETAVITSLAIGLGVDYSIHVGERFVEERRAGESGSIEDALAATVTGTGGALLGSALTSAAGFGVLALALSPPIRRFGLVTGLSIVFAFVACLTVLPCLLVLRERLLGRGAA